MKDMTLKILGVAFIATILCACSSTYNPNKVAIEELATIETDYKYFTNNINSKFNSTILRVYDDNGNLIIDRALAKVKLPAGNYKLNILCDLGVGSAKPDINVSLIKFNHYILSCDKVVDNGKVFAKAKISNI